MAPVNDVRRYEMADSERARPNRAEQACRNLWAAVLAQAVEDFLAGPADFSRYQLIHTGRSRRYEYAQSMRNQYERQRDRVTAWLFEDLLVEAGSFLWICDALGLNQSYVRQKALERKHPMRTFMTVH